MRLRKYHQSKLYHQEKQIMDNVKDLAYNFEAVQVSLRKDKNGYNLVLCVHPDDVPVGLLRDWVGTRYGVAMVRINEQEEVDIKTTELEGKRLVKSAIMSCKEPEFWEVLMDAIDESNHYSHDYHLMSQGINSEELCSRFLKSFLHIESRKELEHNEIAQAKFKELRQKAWKLKNDND